MRDTREIKGDFDFGNEDDRHALVESEDLTYAHFWIKKHCTSIGNACGSRIIGNATVCGSRVGDHLYYGVSLCSPQDNFEKRLGRELARDSIMSLDRCSKRGVLDVADNFDEQPSVLLHDALLNHLSKMKRPPCWVKNAEIIFRGKYKKGLDK